MSSFADRYRVTSDPLKSERRVELVALVLLLLLILQLGWGAYGAVFSSTPEPVFPTPDSMQVNAAADQERVVAEQREQIRQRPLFWVGRRASGLEVDPAAVDVAETQDKAKPGKISGVKLSGVFGAGDSAGIIVIAKGKKRRVMVGEELSGWTLDSVSPVEAIFSDKGQQTSLALERGTLMLDQDVTGAEPPKGGSETTFGAPPESGSLGLGGGNGKREKRRK